MKIITAIPIYRNKPQKPQLFYSKKNFSIGSIIFIPFNTKEKPAIVIEKDDLKNKKTFLRKNTVTTDNIKEEKEIKLFKKEIFEILKKITEKDNKKTEENLQKILTKKILKEINKLTITSDIRQLKKEIDKISPEIIYKKLRKKKKIKIEDKKRGVKNIKDLLKSTSPKKTSIHSELHYLVNEIRNYFGETSKKGKGSFGFYLGFFNRIPKTIIYQYWSEVKDSRKPTKDQQKLFWWKIGQYSKKKYKK